MLKTFQQRLSRLTNRQKRIGWFIGFVLLISVGGWVVVLTPLGNTWEEAIGLDGLFTLRGPSAVPSDVVIVSADRDSADALEQPSTLIRWDRALHARLVHHLIELGAKVIAFDVFFGVPRDPKSDRLFAEAIRHAGNVILVELLDPQVKRGFPVVTRILPMDELAGAAIATAPFPMPMSSATVRQAWHFMHSAGGIATLPLVAFQLYSRAAYEEFLGLYHGRDSQYVDFYGPAGTIATVPYAEVLNWDGITSLSVDFTDKIVFVGVAAKIQPRQKDDYFTPFGAMSGVEIAATMVSNLIEKREIHPLEGGRAIVVLWGIFLGIAFYFFRSGRWLWVWASSLACLYLGTAYYLFVQKALWIPILSPLGVQLPMILYGTMRLKAWMAEEEKAVRDQQLAALETAIRKIMPPDMAQELIDRIQEQSEGEIFVPASVSLRTDVKGYMALSRQLSAQQLGILMAQYYPFISGPAKRHGAVIPPALESGDAMMATWPSPEPTDEVRQQACETALDIIEAVADFNRTHPDTPLPTRIGVHVGKDMTLEWKGLFFSASGFDVNAAQRIESLNKDLKMVGILISQPVVDGLDMYLYRRLGRFHLVGMSEPLDICELMCRMRDADSTRKESVTAWAGALAVYRSQRWDEATTSFEAYEKTYGKDGPCRFYIEQCRRCKTNPPPESWDGVVRLAN